MGNRCQRFVGEKHGPSKHVGTSTLDIAYEESGEGVPVILLHGFPYDTALTTARRHCLPDAASSCRICAAMGRRGFSRRHDALGQQAALGHDLLDLMDAL